jgi:predicted RNase H-like HicB family nuclease
MLLIPALALSTMNGPYVIISSHQWFKIGSVEMELSAVLTPAPEGGYIAYNPETGTTTQGESLEVALANLQEATELYLEEFPLESKGVG